MRTRRLDAEQRPPRSPDAWHVWAALSCLSPLSEQAQVIGVEVSLLRDVLAGRSRLTEAQQARSCAWWGVVVVRYSRRAWGRGTVQDEAEALVEARLVGCRVGDAEGHPP